MRRSGQAGKLTQAKTQHSVSPVAICNGAFSWALKVYRFRGSIRAS